MPESSQKHSHWIEAGELVQRVGSARAPTVIDVRRAAAVEASGRVIAGARWREHRAVPTWVGELAPMSEVVVYCVHGHNLSQGAAALLRSHGLAARALRGGLDEYLKAGGVTRCWRDAGRADTARTCWVTCEQLTIDRLACAWLIRRFSEPHAQILYVEAGHVIAVADELAATAFGIESVHAGDVQGHCSFDACIQQFGFSDPALDRVAHIVRGVDTASADPAPESAGLQALGLGISQLHQSDLAAMEHGFAIYDALYAWARHV